MKKIFFTSALCVAGLMSANNIFATEKMVKEEVVKPIKLEIVKKELQFEGGIQPSGVYCFDKDGNKVKCPDIIIITDDPDDGGDKK